MGSSVLRSFQHTGCRKVNVVVGRSQAYADGRSRNSYQ